MGGKEESCSSAETQRQMLAMPLPVLRVLVCSQPQPLSSQLRCHPRGAISIQTRARAPTSPNKSPSLPSKFYNASKAGEREGERSQVTSSRARCPTSYSNLTIKLPSAAGSQPGSRPAESQAPLGGDQGRGSTAKEAAWRRREGRDRAGSSRQCQCPEARCLGGAAVTSLARAATARCGFGCPAKDSEGLEGLHAHRPAAATTGTGNNGVRRSEGHQNPRRTSQEGKTQS